MRAFRVLFTCLVLAGVAVPAGAQVTRAPFEDKYADVTGQRLHYASVGKVRSCCSFTATRRSGTSGRSDGRDGQDHLAVRTRHARLQPVVAPDGLEPHTMPHLIEDVRQFVEQIAGKGQKFILVGHDWGANVAWVFAMYHPRCSTNSSSSTARIRSSPERELRENPAQRYASNYFFVSTGTSHQASSR